MEQKICIDQTKPQAHGAYQENPITARASLLGTSLCFLHLFSGRRQSTMPET